MWKTLCVIGLGSGLGGMMRYLLSYVLQHHFHSGYPWGTMTVNILGCLCIGLLYALFERENIMSAEMRLLLTTGFCGGFTTFSTFMYENLVLLQSGRWFSFFCYLLFSLVLGFLAVYLGVWCVQGVRG